MDVLYNVIATYPKRPIQTEEYKFAVTSSRVYGEWYSANMPTLRGTKRINVRGVIPLV